MRTRAAAALRGAEPATVRRVLLATLATVAAFYMYRQAHADGVALAHHNGFGSDFRGTIWAPDRAVLRGVSPYPDTSQPLPVVPSVYLPPVFLATLPLAWIPLHVATWIWLAALLLATCGILAALGVRDPWCYALVILSLPVAESLALGNASILVGLFAALTWRYRDRPLLGPLAAAAAVVVKFWMWPLLVWLLITRRPAGVRAAVILTATTLAAWAAIGFRGLLGYPHLIHTEGRYAGGGTLFVAALIQMHFPFRIAAASGAIGGILLLGLAALRRRSDVESFSLALLAALVATPVAWPHYLILMAIPIAIVWPSLSIAWIWFPGLWFGTHLGYTAGGQLGGSLAYCLFAVLPVVFVVLAGSGRRHRRARVPGSRDGRARPDPARLPRYPSCR
jgi:Glycosyltransferase family 87